MYSSARTKKVATYGRRVQRIISATEVKSYYRDSPGRDLSEAKPDPGDDAIYDLPLRSISEPSQRDTEKPMPSDRCSSGKQANSCHSSKGLKGFKETPTRKPLAARPMNIPGSPALNQKSALKSITSLGKGTPPARRLQPMSPMVDVDIIILDDNGRRMSQERRVTKTNVRVNNLGVEPYTNTRKTPGRAAKRIARRVVAKAIALDPEVEDDDDEYVPSPKITKTKTRPTRIPLKVARKPAERKKDSDPSLSDSPDPKRPLKLRNVKRAIITSDSESSFDSEVRDVLPSAALLATAKPPPAKPGSKDRGDPIVIDVSPPPTNNKVAKSTVEVVIPLRQVSRPSGSARDRTSSPEPSFSYRETLRPHHATPTRPTFSRLPFTQYRKPSPIQKPVVLEDEYDLSLSLSIDPELELALKVAELEIGDSPSRDILGDHIRVDAYPVVSSKQNVSSALLGKNKAHAYLRPLLAECGQIMPFDFTEFIETLPYNLHAFSETSNHDHIISNTSSHFQKIGEATYSEVFGIGNIVLKVIPLTTESEDELPSESDTYAPLTSDAKDVLKEILVTRTMGEICKGFIRLLKAHVVQGTYPSQLLDLWDNYNDVKGSESVRPDTFNESQTYAIIVLPNGGSDLETFTANSSITGMNWRKACSIFWQVTRALAHAEDLVHFEHRDLHWGQILVCQTKRHLWSKIPEDTSLLSLDDPVHGVEATIIDLGLSRIGQGNIDTFWTPFTEDIFEGEGDYQYDIYRMMHLHNRDDWESFNPLSNVMWLHYLAEKLVNNKHLNPPIAPTARTSRSRKLRLSVPKLAQVEADKRSYDCLVEMEKILGLEVASLARKVGAKARKRTKGTKQSNAKLTDTLDIAVRSAADVYSFGKERKWIL